MRRLEHLQRAAELELRLALADGQAFDGHARPPGDRRPPGGVRRPDERRLPTDGRGGRDAEGGAGSGDQGGGNGERRGEPGPEALTKQQIDVLTALAEHPHQTMLQVEIAGASGYSKHATRSCLAGLRRMGLVERPHGSRGGEAVTPRGRAVLETLQVGG